MTYSILKIALDVPLDRLFDYLSGGLELSVGQRVLVPFGRRQQVGIVMAMADVSDIPVEKLKSIAHGFSEELPIDKEILQLIKFSADYYHYPFGQALLSALPARLRQTAPAVSRKQYANQLTALGRGIKSEDIPKRQLVMQRVMTALQANRMLCDTELGLISGSARKITKELVNMGWVSREPIQGNSTPFEPLLNSAASPSAKITSANLVQVFIPELNEEQLLAIKHIVHEAHIYKAWLLHGITGSGKTEIYIRLIQYILQSANEASNTVQVLVLVPEINLTPQLEARFKSRFPNLPLVTLHSNLNESERLHHWQLAQSGVARIIIGTRLAIFTPLPHLKLIIIDEEHDSSYKQQDSIRYHARDVALVRAKRLNIPIVLGSATPSLESWYNATVNGALEPQSDTRLASVEQDANGSSTMLSGIHLPISKIPVVKLTPNKYSLLRLNQRAVVAAQLPHIECIDTTKVNVQHGLTPQLIAALRLRLARKEQSLLFINRRGYSPVLLCAACHWVATCVRCSSRLVVHLRQKKLQCHHCGQEQKLPKQCPSCGNPDLHPTGQGTQRLEETLAHVLPNARIARVDRDSTRNKHALVELLNQVHNQQIDVLVGTQMLAKGHDFPNLTLVGVIDTDNALHSPDFRASERLFAQLMQVAGRAGRAEKAGQVIIQTQFPEHALFNALLTQNYERYADAMLLEREQVQFPPYVFTALLRAEAAEFQRVQQFLNHAYTLAQSLASKVLVYEPVRPQMERLKGMERGHLLLQGSKRQSLQKLLKTLVAQLRGSPFAAKVRWAVDVDPLEF